MTAQPATSEGPPAGDAGPVARMPANMRPGDETEPPAAGTGGPSAMPDAGRQESPVADAGLAGSALGPADTTDARVSDAGAMADADTKADAATTSRAGPHFDLPPATEARLKTLITPAVLSATENAAFTDDGRFFVIAPEGIFEIVGGPDHYDAKLAVPVPSDCAFGGLTSRGARLYAPCTHADTWKGELFIYEPSRAEPLVGHAPIATQDNSHFNGSAFGPDGALYLSNSLAFGTGDAAVVRFEILKEEPLEFVQTDFVAGSEPGDAPNEGGGNFPNGVRFDGDTMYYVRGVDVVTTPIDSARPDAPLDVVFEAEPLLPDIDDFDIGDGRMWLCEFSSLRVLGLPGDSYLTVTDLQGNVQFRLDLPFVASSAVVAGESLFGPPSIIITSVFSGGLYRVTFE